MSDDLSDEQIVVALYRAFLGREPEEAVLVYHCQAFAAGEQDARSLTAALANSDEYIRSKAAAPLWVPPGHYYSPIVNPDELRKDAGHVFDRSRRPRGIDLNEDGQLTLLSALRPLIADLPFTETKSDGMLYYFENQFYSYGDGVILAAMIRHLRPQRIVEFGSGFSSCVMLDVNRLYFDSAIDCTFIDPFPERLHGLIEQYGGRAEVIASRAQDIDLRLVSSLEPNDILFIDSTHVTKAGGDVNFHFFEVLPALQPGVRIHFHDIAYPFEYPEHWFFQENRSWNEQYLLRGFLMHNSTYRIEFFNHLIFHLYPEQANTVPFFSRNPGGAIWLSKRVGDPMPAQP